MKLNKIINFLVVLTSIVLGVLLIILAIQVIDTSSKNYFQDNVVIAGVNVKGLTKAQAQDRINFEIKNKTENLELKLQYKEKEWDFNSNDLTVSSEIHTVIDDAFKFSQLSNNSKNKLSEFEKMGINYDITFKKLFPNFNGFLNKIKTEIEYEPICSEVEFDPNSKEIFKITKSQNGLKVDEEKLFGDIEREFLKSSNICVDIKTIQISPTITESSFEGKLELLGEFSTDLSTSKGGRKHNVSLALSKFNGKVVGAGECVSFNEVTGPQTAETGYESAIIIQNGKYVEGIGGGICQASTTLYNALLLSGSEILEVHKHSLPVGYVELSFDAMVNEGTSDMRFCNVSDEPIYIKSYVEGDRAYAKIYGKPLEKGISFKRIVEYVRTIPHKGDKIIKDEMGEYSDKVNYEGEFYRLSYPKEGYEAKGYLEKYINGELVSKEMVRHEIYEPKQGVLIEGVKSNTEDDTIKNDVSPIPPQIEVETIYLIENEVEIIE